MLNVDKIKGNFYIYSNGEYVVLPGTKLYILRTDGSFVACRTDLRYAGRITFLSGNRMLLCSSKSIFHMINLCDGSDIWTAPYAKIDLNASEFAISPDEAFAYTYDEQKGTPFICRLDLQTQEVITFGMYMDVGGTSGIICNKAGTPCMLKSHRETIGGKPIYQHGVRIHDFDCVAPGNCTVWETKWSFEGNRHALCFLEDADTIVTNDLHIYKPSTGEDYDLLENDATWQRIDQPTSDCWLDISKRYLCLQYKTVNVVIDLHARKVVAQYAADFKRGCLIGSEYWICVNDKIHRKPFPAFEAAPPVKVVGGLEYIVSDQPDLW